jgi:hypothetical protein
MSTMPSEEAKEALILCFCARKGQHDNASDDEKSLCKSDTLTVIKKWLPQDLLDPQSEAKEEYKRMELHFQTTSSLKQFVLDVGGLEKNRCDKRR